MLVCIVFDASFLAPRWLESFDGRMHLFDGADAT
jgi:hypothetical protein